MAESTAFRCYYDDGSMIVADYCPLTLPNGAGLVTSEFTIIENVNEELKFPWWILILLAVVVLSEKKG